MTLRHRLLLVFLVVVLLSVATVGVAIYELKDARRMIAELQHWNGIVLNVQRLRTAFERDALLPFIAGESLPPPADADFELLLEQARKYLDFDLVRWAFNVVDERYRTWAQIAEAPRPGSTEEEEKLRVNLLTQTHKVRDGLDHLTDLLERERENVVDKAQQQDDRTRVLFLGVMLLTALHVLVVGGLLRRWLLRPMERLNRQVEALARDQPPPEPLLTTPREIASLARAMDRARRSLRGLRQQLLDNERLTTIGQFTAQLAHNLRNPLASIRAAAQVSTRHQPDDTYIRERMEEIISSVDRLNQWIAGLMEVARREPTPTSSSEVVPTLRRVQQALSQELAVKELKLSIVAQEQGLVCAHHSGTLEHALIAMTVNAIEASPLGGTITLRVEQVHENARPARCRISVEDHGPGLPVEAPEQIFDFSYSTKQRGMGLGLALARQALQRQGGSVSAENNVNGGAKISVELPIDSPEGEPPENG